jgi:Zn-dependent membrane protease YugP
MMLGLMIIDQWWWLAIPGLLLGFYAQYKLTSAYNRYIQVPSSSGVSGAQAARMILDRAGLRDVDVNEVEGHLTDHYDPTKRALFLSSENFHGRSLAALGVAAHEAGHALQHKAAYVWLNLRMLVVPATQFASTAAMWITVLSMFLGMVKILAPIAVAVFAIIAFFQLITLPVEFDASSRAKVELGKLGIVTPAEAPGVSKVLNAAALTYVAAMVAAVMSLVHWMLIARGDDRD